MVLPNKLQIAGKGGKKFPLQPGVGRAARIAAVPWAAPTAQHQPRGTLSSCLLSPVPVGTLQVPCRYGAVLPGSSPRAGLVDVCVPDLCALRGNRNHTCMCHSPCCPSEGHVPGCFGRRARGRAGAVLTFLIWETTEWLGSLGYWSSSTREGSGSSFFPVSLILLKLDLLTTCLFSPLLEQRI